MYRLRCTTWGARNPQQENVSIGRDYCKRFNVKNARQWSQHVHVPTQGREVACNGSVYPRTPSTGTRTDLVVVVVVVVGFSAFKTILALCGEFWKPLDFDEMLKTLFE